MPPSLRTALDRTVEPLRALLRQLDPDEVPESLRKVVAATGKRLPPPLLKSLVAELDRNEWLRKRLAKEVGEGAAPATVAFLERAPGWWMDIAAVAVAVEEDSPDDDHGARLAAMQRKLDEAKRRTAELRTKHTSTTADLKAARKVLRATQRVGADPEVLDLQRKLEETAAQLTAERARADAAEARIAAIKRRVRHRNNPTVGRTATETMGIISPVSVARRLDMQAEAFAAGVRGERLPETAADTGTEATAEPLPTLPGGLAPDAVEAIDWVVTTAESSPLVVDGYNITYLLSPDDFVTPEMRRRLVAGLERLVRRSHGERRVIVVFDSAVETANDRGVTDGGVEVVFATAADTADDEIVDLVAGLGGRAIVVSNDRELRERVDRLGALALWGSALADWIGEA